MPRRSTFTADALRVIGEMRAQGAFWRAIGIRLGRPHQNCRRVWVESLRNPGGWARPRGEGRPQDRLRQPRSDNRAPLPAGDPISWGALRTPFQQVR